MVELCNYTFSGLQKALMCNSTQHQTPAPSTSAAMSICTLIESLYFFLRVQYKYVIVPVALGTESCQICLWAEGCNRGLGRMLPRK